MAAEIFVAVAALVVSLVALVIASGQLLQQIFGTADGYRKCQKSVIGPWSRRTRLIWRWSEFRFETRFTTPEITLFIDTVGANDKKSSSRRKKSIKDPTNNIIDLGQDDLPIELEETVTRTNNNMGFGSADGVTWTSLLRQLCYLQRARQKFTSLQPFHFDSRVAVVYRERTWDLMPAEMSLPVASSTLGILIVLALRLGMTWENLNVGEGILRATGNGQALVSTTIRGLGITFQYNLSRDADLVSLAPFSGYGDIDATSVLIPSTATDRMSCGFVTGNSKFGIRTMPLAGQSSSENMRLLASALNRIGVPRRTISQLTSGKELDMSASSTAGFAINDMIALLSDFLPLKKASYNRIVWPIQTDMAASVFLFYESRAKLLQLLQADLASAATSQDKLEEIANRFAEIENKYPDDFSCNWHLSIASGTIAPSRLKTRFIEHLREIYDWTTSCFELLPHTVGLQYKYLVAEHVVLATNAAATARNQTTNEQEYWARTAEEYVNQLEFLIDRLGSMADIDRVRHNQLDVRQCIKEAWWTLMLRGLVWRMSVYVSHEEKVVPSKYYYDQTPVYIM